jgi:acyl phosphate:glycerol-3-phosphate acyltransferase
MSISDNLSGSLTFLILLAWLSGAYLLGSFPTAWLITKIKTGKDLRQLGSGNVGVMNTAISVSRSAGLFVFLAEISKGVLAALLPQLANASEEILYGGVLALVVGARWPIWLRFKGGRGNTAGLSAVGLISPAALLAAASCWVLARLLLHNSFKATRAAMVVMPVVGGLVEQSWLFFLTLLGLSLIYLHAQKLGSDDHTRIKEEWSSFLRFLLSRPGRGRSP